MSVINVDENNTFEEWRVKTNQVSQAVGDMATLGTENNGNLVEAVNEVNNLSLVYSIVLG